MRRMLLGKGRITPEANQRGFLLGHHCDEEIIPSGGSETGCVMRWSNGRCTGAGGWHAWSCRIADADRSTPPSHDLEASTVQKGRTLFLPSSQANDPLCAGGDGGRARVQCQLRVAPPAGCIGGGRRAGSNNVTTFLSFSRMIRASRRAGHDSQAGTHKKYEKRSRPASTSCRIGGELAVRAQGPRNFVAG